MSVAHLSLLYLRSSLSDFCHAASAATELKWVQWRSQDIAYARAQHGHTMFVLTFTQSAEAFLQPPRECLNGCKVQHIVGLV